jgi:L-aspartate oxidase
METFDFIVVGTGIAGLTVALKAAEHGEVCVLTKRSTKDSNTAWAQGGIACVQGADDCLEDHLSDTLDAGAGLCDESVARTIITEGPSRVSELIEFGVTFDRNADGSFDLTREGGHTRRRVMHSRDTTGRAISQALIAAAQAHPRITIRENHYAIDLVTTGKLGYASHDRAIGLYVLDEVCGEVGALRSDRIFLCTGGSGRVYQYTTNPVVATGDGVAMAWRAGAVISDMEFIQFHPTCLYHPLRKNFLISEALRGEGAILVDKNGHPFMGNYDKRESLAPRDIVARAIDQEIKRTGGPCVYLDISDKGREFITTRFPNIYETCLALGIDATSEPIPVVPAAHYQCGGVRTDINGSTSIRGLYAVGEVGRTGLHGANRLASNSLLEGAVIAHRAVEHAATRFPVDSSKPPKNYAIPNWQSGDVADVDELVVIYHNWDEIRRLMWDYVSIFRTDKRLRRAARRLRNLRREVDEFYWGYRITTEILELRNLIETASLIVDSAIGRLESRGLHYTLDHPGKDAVARSSELCRF